MGPFPANNMAALTCYVTLPYQVALKWAWRRIETSRMTRGKGRVGGEGEGEHEESERKRTREWWGEKLWSGNEGWGEEGWGGVGWGVVGWVLPVSAPSDPVKFYWSSGERAEGAARNRRVFGAFMECNTLLASTHGRPHVLSAASHTLSALLATLLWSRPSLLLLSLRIQFSH